jgi:hypothetical protein
VDLVVTSHPLAKRRIFSGFALTQQWKNTVCGEMRRPSSKSADATKSRICQMNEQMRRDREKKAIASRGA